MTTSLNSPMAWILLEGHRAICLYEFVCMSWNLSVSVLGDIRVD